MFSRSFLKSLGLGLGLLGLAMVAPQSSQAASIGIKLASDRNNSTMNATDVAGAPGYTQANWNNARTGSGTLTSVKDNTGTTITNMTFTWAANGTYNALNGTSTNPDDKLNCGFLYNDTSTVRTWTLTNVPYAIYDVVIYFVNDATNRFARVNVNNTGNYFVRNINTANNQPTKAPYAESPYYDTLAKATADTKGYSHVVIKGLVGATCRIQSVAQTGNYGICAVQVVPSSVTRVLTTSCDSTTVSLGDVVTFNTALTNTGAAVTINRLDLLVDNVVVQTKLNPVGNNNTFTQEWIASESNAYRYGRTYAIKAIATASDNTTLSAGSSLGVCDNYNAYNVIPKLTAFANGVTTVTSSVDTSTDQWGEYAWKAADRDYGTRWNQKDTPNATPPTPSPAWWQVSTNSGNTVNFYRLNGDVTRSPWSQRQPKAFKLVGSNNGTDWTELDSQTGQAKDWSRSYSVATPASYKHYRLQVTQYDTPAIESIEVDEIQLLNLPAKVDMVAPLTFDNIKIGDTVTVKAKVSGTPGAGAEVRFFSGPRLLGRGTDKGNGNWELTFTADRRETIPVFAQLVTPSLVVNSGSARTNVNVTQVPVEMSTFSAE